MQNYFIDCPELFDRKELYGPSGTEYSDMQNDLACFAALLSKPQNSSACLTSFMSTIGRPR
ncbi:MAG: hypothetical protein WDM87_08145 [Terracidiphilus sp.]